MLWEILVPCVRNDGRPIRTRFHRVWDAKVRAVAGGLTVLNPSKGMWTNNSGKVFAERMIPVRIRCTREEIEKIAAMTLKYYEQEAVMYYKISDECIILCQNS